MPLVGKGGSEAIALPTLSPEAIAARNSTDPEVGKWFRLARSTFNIFLLTKN
jgi:hypothetical protein